MAEKHPDNYSRYHQWKKLPIVQEITLEVLRKRDHSFSEGINLEIIEIPLSWYEEFMIAIEQYGYKILINAAKDPPYISFMGVLLKANSQEKE